MAFVSHAAVRSAVPKLRSAPPLCSTLNVLAIFLFNAGHVQGSADPPIWALDDNAQAVEHGATSDTTMTNWTSERGRHLGSVTDTQLDCTPPACCPSTWYAYNCDMQVTSWCQCAAPGSHHGSGASIERCISQFPNRCTAYEWWNSCTANQYWSGSLWQTLYFPGYNTDAACCTYDDGGGWNAWGQFCGSAQTTIAEFHSDRETCALECVKWGDYCLAFSMDNSNGICALSRVTDGEHHSTVCDPNRDGNKRRWKKNQGATPTGSCACQEWTQCPPSSHTPD